MKSLLKFCVDRPLGVIAVYAALFCAGLFCWFKMPQELMPDLRFPQLSVVTVVPNASPEEVENLATKPVEQALGTVKNVRRLDSSSKQQVSVVNVEFRWDTDMDAALLWVQEKLGLVQDQLPLEAAKPVVLRYNPFDRPVVLLSVSGGAKAQDLARLVEGRMRPLLEKVSGVSAVQVSGALQREIHIDVDAEKLSAHRLSITDVADALRRRNVSRSAGAAAEGLFEYPITVSGSFADLDGIRQAVLVAGSPREGNEKDAARELVRIESLGAVSDGVRERTSFARNDGRDNVAVAVYKRAEAYPIEVSRNVLAALDELRRQLPKDVQIRAVYDQSISIEEGISHVFGDVVVGGLLAFFILWAFLKSRQRALIVGLTIPMALLMAIAVLYQMKMSVNMLTLGGLALGVGMLVDAAVVIMENISRHMDLGSSVKESVVEGGAEVGKAVFFCVMTHLAAFAPIPFASVGVAQRVFTPICVAVVVSQLASLVAGFTLVPALTALILKDGPAPASHPRRRSAPSPAYLGYLPTLASRAALLFRPWLERGKRRLDAFMAEYDRALHWCVAHRRKVLLWTAGCTLVNVLFLLFVVQKETMPDVDQDQFIVKISLPMGTRLEVTDGVARRVEEVLAAMPEVAHQDAVVGSEDRESPGALGPHQAQIVVDLAEKVRSKSGRTRARRRCRFVMREASRLLSKLDVEGARFEFQAQGGDVFSQVFGKGGGADLVVEVKGQDLAAMKAAAAGLEDDLRKVRGVSKVTDSLTAPALQLQYDMDELRLARDGLSVADAAETVLAGINGSVPTKFRDQGKEVDIRLRLREEDRKDASALERLVINNPVDKAGHPLVEYGRLKMAPGPSEIRRRDQARTILVSIQLSGRSLSDVLPEVRALAAARRSREMMLQIGGEVEEMRASFISLLFGFAASVALVYIVLVAQFNTLWVPLVAMVAIPLSVNGVAPALILSGHTLNLMSGQGMMMLGGIVVNNSLMLLEFVQQRREEGRKAEEAVIEAGHTRLRPIYMTVICTVAGLLPLALGIGKGAEMQAPMAVTVIFGLLVSTVLTLLVLPVLYLEARRIFEK